MPDLAHERLRGGSSMEMLARSLERLLAAIGLTKWLQFSGSVLQIILSGFDKFKFSQSPGCGLKETFRFGVSLLK